MAISHETKASTTPGQRQFGSLDSGLLKICIGAPFLAARQHQRRAFTQIASKLFTKTADFKALPTTSFYSRCSRYCSSKSASSANPDSSKNGFLGWYLGKLNSHPLITKGVSTSVIFTLADVTAQVYSFNYKKTILLHSVYLLILRQNFENQSYKLRYFHKCTRKL